MSRRSPTPLHCEREDERMRYIPKHLSDSVKSIVKARPLVVVMVSLILISAIAAGAAAILRDSSGSVTEELGKAEVTCEVNDDYSVTNTGNIPALIRVKVIVNKTDGDEIIPGDTPAFDVAGDWTENDGYLYYNAIVSNEDGENDTTVPITFTDTVGDDIQVLILAEAIQAAVDAAAESWGLSFSNGSWS